MSANAKNGARNAAVPRQSFRIGAFTIEPALGRIVGPSGPTHVEPRVMDVMSVLAKHAPQPVLREELIQAVWGHSFVTDGVVTRCISLLRHCLKDDHEHPKLIETLAKRGYRLCEPVVFVDEKPSARTRLPADGTIISIAVLPFLNLSGNPADEYVADGLTGLLIAKLAGVESLRVISRTSTMVYKHAGKRVTEIAAELDVSHVVEGSVWHNEGSMQVAVQLVDAALDMHLWTHSHTCDPGAVLPLLNEIAASVARVLRATVTSTETSWLARPLHLSEDALHAYLRGRHLWAQRTGDSLRKAAESFGECARQAPDFAPAFGGWADCHIVLALYGIDAPNDAGPIAREYSDRACVLDPESGEAQACRGSVRLFFDWDFEGAEACYERAIALAPSHSITYLSYGDLKVAFGEFDAGMALLRQAVKLSPFDLGYSMNVGDFLFFGGRFSEAADQQEKTLDLAPHFVPSRLRLAESLAMVGRKEDARREAERALAEAPKQPRVRESHAFVLAACGMADEARAELRAIEAESAWRYVNPWELARAYAVMGDVDTAFLWLNAGCNGRAPHMILTGIYPPFHGLRSDPRFAPVLRRIGLPCG